MLWSGVGVWLIGFIFESISDTQMAKFKKNHLNKGKLLTNGLWKYSRHPNYFGEVVQWWGIFLVALSAGTVAWYLLIIGPCVISLLIRFVSGVPLAESRMKDRVEFKHYASKTNALIPWFAK
jgi:steroid 5-alpha reductase family enzyme